MTSAVPPGRVSLHRYPGTSCLATISLSLRDKSHSPIEAPTIILALMRVYPGLAKITSLVSHEGARTWNAAFDPV